MELLENGKIRLKSGEVWMKLGNHITREQILEQPDRHFKNLIVDICSELIAEWSFQLLTPTVPGILTLAVGTGGSGWDIQNPPAETSDLTQLYSELARKQITSRTYVDDAGVPVGTRTNKIEFTTLFDYAEANGPLVEMGLFGGTNSLAAGDGTRVNAKHFPVLNKDETSQLNIMWKLIF
jgi:hypothetical protein